MADIYGRHAPQNSTLTATIDQGYNENYDENCDENCIINMVSSICGFYITIQWWYIYITQTIIIILSIVRHSAFSPRCNNNYII